MYLCVSKGGASYVAQSVKDLPAMLEFDSWVGKIPWRRKWQPTLVFLPGESHRQRSLVAYSPWCLKSQIRLGAVSLIFYK